MKIYYVDNAGSDSAAGTTPETAWKTVTRANKATLYPGDSLLFKRGCTWKDASLSAKWAGSESAPITISSYGDETQKPRLWDHGITVTGKYLVINDFEVDFPVRKTGPGGQPLGQYYAINITSGGTHCTVTNCLVQHATVGLHISKTAGSHNTVQHNEFAHNNVMQEPFDGSGDLGAWGMLVRGSYNDIGYNYFHDNAAIYKFHSAYASNSVELYEADYNLIHHNVMLNDRVFSELGSSSTNKANNNYYAFNVMSSNLAYARFITTRGALDTSYGPVNGTVVERNSVNFTGAGSEGLICGRGSSASILTARYNIINVVFKTIYFDKTMGQNGNLLWSQGKDVHIQDGSKGNHILKPGTVTTAYRVGDPKFVSANDLHLQATSPAIGRGGATVHFDTDAAGVPISDTPSIGAYEYVTSPQES